jgi:flagellar biosynthesis protein FlhG
MVINENVKRKIIPIAGGKGGVGKTVLSANLALALAGSGKNTIVIDLDLGGSNLHTCLGLKNNKPGIGNFISSRDILFQDIIQKTPYKNLRFIAGDVLVPGLANISFSQKKKLLNNILKLEAEYVLLDLGSGSNFNVIDFFLMSNSGFAVTTGQTTSVLNVYGFLKSLVFRFLMRAFNRNEEVSFYLRSIVKEKDPNSFVNIAQIIKKIHKIDPESGKKAKKYISVLKPKIVINMAESPDVILIIEKLRDLIKNGLVLDVECMGLIYSDDTVNQAITDHVPVSIKDKHSIASKDIERIAQKIIQSGRFPEMPLDFNYYKDTFELTQIEAQNDFQEFAGLNQLEEEVNIGKLLSVIDTQKKHIKDLEGTLRMLTQNRP